jgi:hypothetical protein
MTITIHEDLLQGSDEWLAARCGMITASTMKLIVPASVTNGKEGKPRNNDKVRSHLYELAAQRISGYVEPAFISDDMLRGMTDEEKALEIYAKYYGDVHRVGFITNDKFGFGIGYSPDALVGDYGAVEIKRRAQRFQIETILQNKVPAEYMAQIQTGLAVTERQWVDFVSYSPGLPYYVKRVWPDAGMQAEMLPIAAHAEAKINEIVAQFRKAEVGMLPTERLPENDGEILT